MESCEMSLIKYVLFIFNLLFALSGLGIIIAGSLVLSDVADFSHFVDSELVAPPIVLIVAGAIVFIVAFLGCFGAIRESYNLLVAFAVCLLVIFIVELAVGIAAACYKNQFGEALRTTLKQSMANYTQNQVERIAWDNAQKKLKCCGVESSDDWSSHPQIPYSCCSTEEAEDEREAISQYCINGAKGKYMYKIGCYDRLKMKINDNTKILIGVGIGIAFIEIVGIVLACWLAHTIKREEGSK